MARIMSRESSGGDHRPQQLALLAIVVLFVAVVTAGWHRLLAPVLSTFTPSSPLAAGLLSAVAALAIAIIAVILARAVADERVDGARARENKSAAGNDRTWWAYFFILFALSALGTMNTVFYYGEGGIVLREHLAQARQCLNELETTAKDALQTPAYSKRVAQVNGLLTRLEEEIRNPRNCGEGPEANRILQQLGRELGSEFTPLSGRSRDCQRVHELMTSYRRIAADLLRTSPDYTRENVARKEALMATIAEFTRSAHKRLDDAESALAAGSRGDAQDALEGAASYYGKMTLELTGASGGPQTTSCTIDVRQIRGLGSIAQVIPILMHRLDHLSTYLYILLALLLDVILIACFMRVLRSAQQPTDRPPTTTDGASGRQPHFLWVNP